MVPERSRASSIAATLNDEPGELDLQSVHSETDQAWDIHNQELVPDATSSNRVSLVGDQPPSPAALSVEFDPEELTRPLKASLEDSLKLGTGSSMTARGRSNAGRNIEFNANPSKSAASVDLKGKTPSPGKPSSTESLTEGALVHVPSQLSNVVMSYRTNEWAKHISTAEMPIDDQSNTVLGDVLAESPVQLIEAPAPVKIEELAHAAGNTRAAADAGVSNTAVELPIGSGKRHSANRHPLESHVVPGRVTLENDNDAPNLHRSLSDRSLTTAPSIVIRPPTAASGQYASRPSRVSRTNSAPQGNQILPTTIDENVEIQFSSKSPSLSPPPASPTHSTSPPPTARAETAPGGTHLLRSASYQSLPMATPSQEIYQQALATTSDTRLSSSFDSRQPARRSSTFVPGKRDSMLADWQGSLKRESSMTAIPKAALEQRRAEMMLERRQSKQSRQREEVTQQYREKVVERAMRTTDMQALHREAMRKMQAKANRHV